MLRWALFIPFGLAALGLVQAAVLALSTVVTGSIVVMLLQASLLGFALISTLVPLTATALVLTLRICPQPRLGLPFFATAFVITQATLLTGHPAAINADTRFWIGSVVTYVLFTFSVSMTDIGKSFRYAGDGRNNSLGLD